VSLVFTCCRTGFVALFILAELDLKSKCVEFCDLNPLIRYVFLDFCDPNPLMIHHNYDTEKFFYREILWPMVGVESHLSSFVTFYRCILCRVLSCEIRQSPFAVRLGVIGISI